MGRSWLARSLIVVVVGVITAPGQPAAAAVCSLVPELRAVTVNQGLGSYTPLVRGKETLFRAFLGKPRCAAAADSMKLTGAQLQVSNGATVLATIQSPTPAAVPTFAEIASSAAAPVADWAGDPIFVIPGSALAPASNPAAFTATFTVTISYTATAATSASAPGTSPATFTALTGSRTTLTANVDRRSSALRVLVQPMGDPTKTFDSQFSAQAQSAIQDGMVALSRIAPVPDGIGSLLGTTGGLRYTINTGILDVTPFLVAKSPSGVAVTPSKFCGTAATFDSVNGVKAKLDLFLQAWNAANPTHTADRILGVVDEAISLGGSFGCAEGMAAANGKQAWTRGLYSATPSMTGALTAMELLHTGGAVPANRYDPYNPWHSPNAAADSTSPGRAYNVSQRAYLGANKSVMNFTSNWNGTNTLAERDDYALWRCLLGGTTTTECTTAGVVGTAEGVGANPTLTATGNVTVDATGKVLTVTDVNSYFTAGMALTPTAPSPLTLVQSLVQQNGTKTILRSDPCPITFAITNHDGTAEPATPAPENNTRVGSFFCAEPYNTSTTLIELVKDGVAYYTRATGVQPGVTSTSATSESCRTPAITRFPVATPANSPFKITSGPDGNLWFTENGADKIGKITVAGEITEYAIPRWLPTGSMTTGRYLNTATVLNNGKVLVAGGFSAGNVALSSAELYDPANGTWTSTGSMAAARSEHTATLLGNGKVLVVGGINSGGFLASAELYDPVAGTWSATGSLTGSRYRHTATLLVDGTVLVAAGWSGAAIASAERYNVTSGTWSAAASLGTVRVDHTATLLANGTVLVAGGWTGTAALASTEIYVPGVEGDSWTTGPSMAGARYQHVAVKLSSTKVLVAGGKNTASALSSAEVYDGTTWNATGAMNTARAEYQGVVLGNGKALVVGGFPGGATAELFSPSAGTWTATDSMGTARGENTVTLIDSDKVLVAGGYGGPTTAIASAEIYAASLGPNGIASGPGGLWFTEDFADRIGKITTAGVVTQFAIRPNSFPIGITAGPAGSDLWFAERGANRIGQITPAGVVTEYPIADGPNYSPDNITSGPDGNLWFTELSGAIGRITPMGVVTEYSVAPGSEPRGITRGPDGNLWFSDRALNKVGRITTLGAITEFAIPTTGSQPLGITSGPDGRVWFAESSASKIGSIATSGENVITEYADADKIVSPLGITLGPDNNLWFAQAGAIGRFAPCVGGTQATAVASFGNAPPLERRMDILSCRPDAPRPDVCFPIAVALSPDSSNGSSSTFTYHFNNSSCAGTTLRFLANNGIQLSAPSDTSSGASCPTNPPAATIDLPLAGQTFLSYETITLRGTATSQGSPLAGSALQFSTNATGVAIPAGALLDLTPPAGGWTPGTYNVGLVATAGPLTGAATTTITIKKDTAHVGRSDEFVSGLLCKPVGVTTFEPFADWDGDGIDNISDSDVCTKATTYAALMISFPQRITLPTAQTTILGGLVVPYQTVENVNGATVRIVKVADKDVSANPLFTSPNNTGWSVLTIPPDTYASLQAQIPGLFSNKFGGISFDAQKFIQYVKSAGLVNRTVTIEVEMQSQGATPWTARGRTSIFVAAN